MPIEADVSFSDFDANTADFTFTPGTPSVVIATAGTYLVWFSLASVQANQFAVMQNGTSVPGGLFGSGAGTQQNSGMTVIVASAGDVLTLRNHSSAAAVTLHTFAGGTQANTNASLILQKIN